MADDWEQEDWEAEDFKPQLPATTAGKVAGLDQYETAGQALLAKATEPDMSKFEDEDQQEPEEEKSYHIKPQPKKKVEKKYTKAEYIDDTPLDDPEAERLRRQRLEEESDLRAINEMFGGERASQIQQLDSMIPKSVKDFEEAADLVAKLFITQHRDNKNYKAFVKALLKVTAEPLNADDSKEIENLAGNIRADKVKAEKAAAAAKKGAKKSINVGKAGASAGLDDYIYDAPEEDEYDFM